MRFYDFLGYSVGYIFVFFFIVMFVTPFFIVVTLMNDKTYNSVKAKIDDPASPWEVITKQK